MSEDRPWTLRMAAWALVVLGLLWILGLVGLAWLGFTIRGPCGTPPTWPPEHTAVLVVGLAGLGLPWVLRRRADAATTLVDGRPLGWTDSARQVLPVLAAAILVACSTRALVDDGHYECGSWYREPIPWWSSWSYVAAYAIGVLVALTGTSRS
ncbi:MAG: hypothetical protein H6712_09585 [Myxococcales bacterium]|nr:hypothetical protein [Myxococcales bacterium]